MIFFYLREPNLTMSLCLGTMEMQKKKFLCLGSGGSALGFFFLVEIWGLADIAGDDTAIWTNKFLKLLKWIVCVKMNIIMCFFM